MRAPLPAPARWWRLLLLAALALTVVGSVALALRLRMPVLLGLPAGALLLLLLAEDYRPVFWMLIAAIPCSIQVELGGGFSMDLVSEPLMLTMLAVFLISLAAGRQFAGSSRLYPFHLLIFLLLFWTLLTTVTSHDPARSAKFLLAKLWYLAAFIWMADRILDRPERVRTLFWAFFIPLVLVSAGITLRHAASGFSFEEANGVAFPLFPNGVIYSATLVLFLPWGWFALRWYTPKSLQWYLILAGLAVLLLGIVFSYKRGAWLAAASLPLVYLLLQRKWLDKLLLAGVLGGALLIGWLVQDNRFYRFAPNYQDVIWHEGDFSAHLEATFQGTEISGMERFYRWVAAKNMIQDMPLFGSGPSTFNQVYKRYADDAFRTYVSDNPEQSTTHNYFLMTFAEQGFPGGLLFLGLCIYMTFKAVRLGYRVRSPERRTVLLGALFSLVTILLHSLLNEMIEVDKVGAMFWLNLLLIHKTEVWDEPRTGTGPHPAE
ncbi:MAG: O-antigen ligase family protein [Bacteroidia bacterium]|nr:O-antigen ligase family protein [Bacteroidia bacterium]